MLLKNPPTGPSHGNALGHEGAALGPAFHNARLELHAALHCGRTHVGARRHTAGGHAAFYSRTGCRGARGHGRLDLLGNLRPGGGHRRSDVLPDLHRAGRQLLLRPQAAHIRHRVVALRREPSTEQAAEIEACLLAVTAAHAEQVKRFLRRLAGDDICENADDGLAQRRKIKLPRFRKVRDGFRKGLEDLSLDLLTGFDPARNVMPSSPPEVPTPSFHLAGMPESGRGMIQVFGHATRPCGCANALAGPAGRNGPDTTDNVAPRCEEDQKTVQWTVLPMIR